MLNILLMIILIIIIFIIILLLIGIKITFRYNKIGSEFKGCLKILIFKKIKVYSTKFPSDDKDDNSNDEKEHKKRDIKKILKLAKPCVKDLIEYLKSSAKIIKITKINNHFLIGMNSYVDTAKYIGIIWAILSIINPIHENLTITAQPSFNGSTFDAKGDNEIEIYPLKLFIPTIRLLLKKDVLKLIKGVIDER